MENYKAAPMEGMPERPFEKPVFTVPLFGPSEIMEGAPAHFEARVVPIGDPDLKIQWYVNGVALKLGNLKFLTVIIIFKKMIKISRLFYKCLSISLFKIVIVIYTVL